MNTISGAVRAFSTALVLTLAAVCSSAALAAQVDPTVLAKISDKAARGEPVKLIVRLKGDSSAKALNANARATLRSSISAKQLGLLKRHGAWFKTVKQYRETPYVALETDEKGLAALLADGDVTSIEEDIPLKMTLNETPLIIDADLAWNSGYRGAGQAVAILDTGVDTAHPFFAGKIVAEACFSQNGTSTTSRCPNGQNSQIGTGSGVSCSDAGCWHGTHVAGIAAGKSGILGGAGMGPDAKIIPIQVFTRYCDAAGACSLTAYSSDIGLALDHVFRLSSSITIASVNLSLGGGSYTAACDSLAPSIKELIDTLRNVKIATVVSSGNGSATNAISFPACISSAISVGSTTKQNTIASYSNSSAQLSLLAPGSGIYSSVSGGGYGTANGTSMAAPHVAGIWTLMKSAKPSATVTEILASLQSTGLPITDSRNGLSKPLIQIGGSAGAIVNMVGVANQPPTVTLTGPANNASFTAPATMTLTATANDADGAVAKVEFYQGGSLIGTDSNGADGWSVGWSSVPVGNYTLTAKAFDNVGASTASPAVSISVTAVGGGIETVWVEDAVPSGATVFADAESWNWVSTPAYSGSLAHASGLVGGMHQHYFYNASATLSVQTGDTLYAYVYLDPANPPNEVMLQWNDGDWNARAYWGANLIGWGTDGTASRKYMGPLPAPGQWVRLEVPASLVGLEGKTLNGMAFTLYGGKAVWDKAGKSSGAR